MLAEDEVREIGITTVVFGDLLRDPLVVAVTVEPHGAALDDDALAAAFEEFREQPTPAEEGMTMVGERIVDTSGDMPAFREHHRLANGLEVFTWYQLRPDHRVTVEGAWWGDRPEAQAVVEAAYASLRLDE
jgi:hypothetical protein